MMCGEDVPFISLLRIHMSLLLFPTSLTTFLRSLAYQGLVGQEKVCSKEKVNAERQGMRDMREIGDRKIDDPTQRVVSCPIPKIREIEIRREGEKEWEKKRKINIPC